MCSLVDIARSVFQSRRPHPDNPIKSGKCDFALHQTVHSKCRDGSPVSRHVGDGANIAIPTTAAGPQGPTGTVPTRRSRGQINCRRPRPSFGAPLMANGGAFLSSHQKSSARLGWTRSFERRQGLRGMGYRHRRPNTIMRQCGFRSDRPQSSPASRVTAGALGFLTFTQCAERPER